MKILTYDNESKIFYTNNMCINILICDPNQAESHYFAELISKIAEKKKHSINIKIFHEGLSLIKFIRSSQEAIHVVILEIDLPNQNGINLALKLRKEKFEEEILILTHSEDYYPMAFDVMAFHYIVKGKTSNKHFSKVISNLFERISRKQSEYILFNKKGEHLLMRIKDIQYFEIDKRVVTVHYNNNKFQFMSTMEKVQQCFDGKQFIRVHRSFLVAFQEIERIQYDILYLKNGDMIPIGRTYQKIIQHELSRIGSSDSLLSG